MSEAGAAGSQGVAGSIRVGVLVLAVLGFAAAVALIAAGPFLYRAGVVDLETAGSKLQMWAMWLAMGSAVLGLVGLVLAFVGHKHRAGIVGVLVVAAAAMAAGTLYSGTASQRDLPPIYDVQTDWTLPVAFTEATLKAREKAGAVRIRDDARIPEGEGHWSGKLFSEAQAGFYDDVKPLLLKGAPADTVKVAAKAMERIGCKVTTTDVEGGVAEGVFATPWYELQHDIAVRVTPNGTGSRIDIRAASRLPGHDMGGNAALVKQLLDEIVLVQ